MTEWLGRQTLNPDVISPKYIWYLNGGGLSRQCYFFFFFLKKKTHVDRYSDRADINYYNTKTGALIRMGMLIGRRALNQMFDFHRLS